MPIELSPGNIACIISADKIFWSQTEESDFPWSALAVLLFGIHNQFNDQSLRLTRLRIYHNYPLCAWDEGTLKVAGKRASYVQDLSKFLEPYQHLPFQKIHKPSVNERKLATPHWEPIKNDTQAFRFLSKVLTSQPQSAVRYQNHRQIAALLVNAQGQVVSVTKNTNALNKTQHAEINLLLDYWNCFRSRIPDDFHLYVTHKPCRMCSGLISQMFSDVGAPRVTYLFPMTGAMNDNGKADHLCQQADPLLQKIFF